MPSPNDTWEDGIRAMINTNDENTGTTCDVLVIDDNEDIVRLLTSYLEGKGIRAKGMTSGTDLADTLVRDQPRLVLLDVMMPVFNGFALFESIKKEAARTGTRVYFISALPERNLAWYVRTNGAAGYITKPFSMAAIDAVLAETGLLAKR
ncbi:MAG: response regulator [Candidatus Sigynarchaeota archaeon]